MIEIRRLNMDSSWQLRWQGVSIIIDPWLMDSEVDGFSWLNEQWHIVAPVPVSEVGAKDLVIVSQPYTDHCHAATLKALQPFGALMAVKPARKRIEKELGYTGIITIPDALEGWAQHGPLQIAKISPPKWIDPIYHALIIRSGEEAIFYSPHGFVPTEIQLALLRTLQIKLLITSFSYYRIPAILGGLVNPGADAARELATLVNAEKVINTHDEQKEGKGLVTRLAKKIYYNMHHESGKDKRILPLEDYSVLMV